MLAEQHYIENYNKIMMKKIYNILFFIIIYYTILLNNAYCDLKPNNWVQKNIFTNYGQEIEIIFDLKAKNLEKNYYYYSWSFIFDKKNRINIIEVSSLNNKKVEYSFGDNILKIKFDKLFNNQLIKLKVKYQEFNNNISKTPYIRRELVQIPDFLAGTKATIFVKTLNEMDIYSLNEAFKKNGDIYKWSDVVSKNGFYDFFEMTIKEAKWHVSSIFELNSDNDIKSLKMKIPLNYIGGNNKVIEYIIKTNQNNNQIKNIDFAKNVDTVVEFKNFYSTEAIVKIDAIITNNYNNFYWMNNFNINDTLDIKNEYINTYNTLINKIQEEDKIDLPTHIKIAKWVNKNVIYTESYIGKNMTSMQILQEKKGVCEHYAVLYQDLLRSIGIPAKTISGISYNFKKQKFENHAWVIINYNNQWLPIDPTWGIYSGKLPISHIFLYNDIKNTINFQYPSKLKNVKTNIINKAEFIKE